MNFEVGRPTPDVITMLHIVVRQVNEATVLDLSGQLGFGFESQTLCQRIRELVADNQTRILLNVEGVTLIDSCGVAELVSSLATVRKSGGSLKVSGPTKQVREVLRITRLATIIEIFESEKSALASFAPTA